MTENASQHNREKPRCSSVTRTGEPCRGLAVTEKDGARLCRVHGGVVDQAELGRRSAASRKARKAKGKAGSFREALRRTLEHDPEKYAARLLDSGAAGMRLASELLEAEEKAKEEQQAGPIIDDTGRPVTGLGDVVRLVYGLGQQSLVGLPSTPAELAALVAMGVPAPEERGTQVPSEEPAARTSAPVDEESPQETDDLVLEEPLRPDVRRSLDAVAR